MDIGMRNGGSRLFTKRGLAAVLSVFAVGAYGQPYHAYKEHIVGKWEGPYDWPVVAIHAALLPDGTVVAYDSVGDHATETYPADITHTRAMLWDPASDSVISSELNLDYNIFCSGLGMLSNGHVFIAGGNFNKSPTEILLGIPNLTDYDPFSPQSFVDRFAATGTMLEHRWYPSVTALANGEMLISGGVTGESTPEVRETNGYIRPLSDARSGWGSERIYSWLKQAPNGNVALLGPAVDMHFLHTEGTGRWEDTSYPRLDNRYRDYGSHVLYDIGKALVTGGSTPATDSAVLVDLDTMQSTYTKSMHYERRHHNLTVLPDGSVLATGGFSGDQPFFDFNRAVYRVERWNPRTGKWRKLAPMLKLRGYHSIALLLPDGRVLSAGGGICGPCTGSYLEKNAEIFSPPYLFNYRGRRARRAVISAAPDKITPGEQFNITVSSPGKIKSIALIRLGAVTHSTNMDQRYIPLAYAKGENGQFSVSAPANNNIAPPGHYMLFVNPGRGAPSIAKILQVSGGEAISYQPPQPQPQPQPPGDPSATLR